MPEAFDVVVVGGGTAGCVVAARLSERPLAVCVVEAGPDYGPHADGGWPEDILDGRWLALDSHCWETDRDDRSQLRARILGGCSSHNACVLIAGPPADYDEWGEGWSHAVIEPYLRRAEQAFGLRTLEADELSPWHRAWVEAAGDDALVHPVNLRGWTRWNAAFAYLDPARARENLTIRADALADCVLLDDDRAVGVSTSRGDVMARTVVLTSGAYGSPGILLRSGIGPGRGLPVGEGLADHVGTGMAWRAGERARELTAAHAATHGLAMAGVTVQGRSRSCDAGVCDLFLFPAMEPDGSLTAAVFAMKPHGRGTVRLNGPDPATPLAIEHGFLADPRDAEVLTEGFEQLRALGTRPPIRELVTEELRPGAGIAAGDHVRATARGFFHPVGTCAIGRVVDGDCRVYGYDGLVVADASAVPTIPRANTNLTAAALAERIAERIAADLGAPA
jgi:choline dehydrogenase